jgi:hypothetical protein
MSKEIWKKLDEIEGAFVSNFGNVKSVTSRGQRILKPQVYCKKGSSETRLRVMIDRRLSSGKVFYPFVHTLVAKYFLGTPKGSAKVIFRDGNPMYCGVFNLAYMYDFDTKADHTTLEKYSKYTSESGVAIYEYCNGNDKPLQAWLQKWSVSMSKILAERYKLSDTDANESYWTGATKFMQKCLIGFMEDGTNEGLLFSMSKWEALGLKSKQCKLTSEWQSGEDGDFSTMDNYITCDLEGNINKGWMQ